MTRVTTLLGMTTILTCAVGTAHAAGIERSRLSYGVLFEEGRYMELGMSSVTPEVMGNYIPLLGGGSTGNMAESYQTLSFAYKADLTDSLSYGVFVNQPYGADAAYPSGFYTGLEAHWESQQVAAILKYDLAERVSVHGGLRFVESSATINIPPLLMSGGASSNAVFNFSANGEKDAKIGYVIGAAYQIPDIALRAALTYEGAIAHEFDTTEVFPFAGGASPFSSVTEVELPQSVTLDFQSGIAADTLLFGSVKWAEWSVWEVRTALFEIASGGDAITGFDNDVVTYQLGVGRKLNENLSVFARAGYEKSTGGESSRLAPTDGMSSIGLGGSWKQDNVKITGGLEYVWLGDAVDASATQFTDNHALGFGVSVGYSF